MILAAVHAPAERLIEATKQIMIMIQIFTNLAFSYTKRELFGS